MTDHDHSTFVPGCYRCDLSRDEVTGRQAQPKRIQLSRTKGWRKPEGAIVVSRPSKWGNPFQVSPFQGGWSIDDDLASHYGVWEMRTAALAEAVRMYDQMHLGAALGRGAVEVALRGHDLACWCPLDQPCHADVLLEVANA